MDETAKFQMLVDNADRPECDEVFERLARGELSPAEELALRTAEDPETRRLYELFRPLDANDKQRFEDAVRKTFPNPQRNWWTRQSRVARWTMLGGPMLAAAAALIIVLSPREPKDASPLEIASSETLVKHTDHGTSLLGTGQPSGSAYQLFAGTCWNLQLRLEKRSGHLPKSRSVHTYFVQAANAVAWEVDWKPQKNNSLAPVDGCAQLPPLASGNWELIVLSGRDAPRPDAAQAAAVCRSGPPTGAGWRCDSHAVEIVPNSP